MITKFIERFDAKRDALRAQFKADAPGSYDEIIDAVIKAVADEDDYETPDPKRVTRIDHGEYQGTVVYVIGSTGYQPSTYWYVKVGYGSCSGCDALQGIGGYSDDVSDEQAGEYLTLALHVLQGLKEMGE